MVASARESRVTTLAASRTLYVARMAADGTDTGQKREACISMLPERDGQERGREPKVSSSVHVQ